MQEIRESQPAAHVPNLPCAAALAAQPHTQNHWEVNVPQPLLISLGAVGQEEGWTLTAKVRICMFNLCLVTYKNIQGGETHRPWETALPNRLKWVTPWYHSMIQLSGWVQVSQSSALPGSLTAENCSFFILGCIFFRDYFQESWVSANNCRYKYLFVGHSIFAVLFTCTSQAQKFVYVWLRLAFHGDQIPTCLKYFQLSLLL